jgi:enediyne biosynthesis protein E4
MGIYLGPAAVSKTALALLLVALLSVRAITGGPAVIFKDAAEETGLKFQHFIGATGSYFVPEIFGSGIAVIDYDGDGDLDIYIMQGTILDKTKSMKDSMFPPPTDHFPGNRLYRNELIPSGKLSFTDVTEKAGVGGNGGYSMGVAVGDYDNDGRPDIYVTNYGRDILYHNNGDGTFSDVSKDSIPQEESFGSSAAFVDYDRDGYLDLYVVRYNSFRVPGKVCTGYAGGREYCGPNDYRPIPGKLYHNEGNGHFVDVTAKAGTGTAFGNGLGVICADFNDDGWIDIFVANDKTPNQLWINRHNGTFEDEALVAGVAYDELGKEHAGMGVTAADFDGDGDEDIFIANIMGETHMLYQNQGKGMFRDATTLFGLGGSTVPFTGFGTLWFDYDDDGKLDIFITNGEVRIIEALRGKPFPFDQKCQLFHNDGKIFRDVSAESGPAFQVSAVGRGAAFGDIDNDGDVDIAVSNANGPARLLLNQAGNRNHWLNVRARGTTVNRDAFGSRIALNRKGRTPAWSRVASDGSYLSANDPFVHFGLGNDEDLRSSPPESLLVIWPDGSKETWPVEKTDTLLILQQGKGAKP